MKEQTSLAKCEANRQNAKKSTGPKTDKGKRAAKMNALKHGLLAREVVITDGQVEESPKEFAALWKELREDRAPMGLLEEMLVERIATCYWRLRRVLTAEAGEIGLRVNVEYWRDYWWKRLADFVEARDADKWERSETDLLKTSYGCDFVVRHLGSIREQVEQRGELTEDLLDAVKEILGENSNTYQSLLHVYTVLRENPKGLETDALKAEQCKSIRQALDDRIQTVGEVFKGAVAEVEGWEDEARSRMAFLPSPEATERLTRYEAHLERQLYRALNQLERLQRQRRGEDVPPPLSMEVNTPG